jgi:hypothetical protein
MCHICSFGISSSIPFISGTHRTPCVWGGRLTLKCFPRAGPRAQSPSPAHTHLQDDTGAWTALLPQRVRPHLMRRPPRTLAATLFLHACARHTGDTQICLKCLSVVALRDASELLRMCVCVCVCVCVCIHINFLAISGLCSSCVISCNALVCILVFVCLVKISFLHTLPHGHVTFGFPISLILFL